MSAMPPDQTRDTLSDQDDDDPFALDPDLFLPTVGYCSKCGEARTSFYTCRDGGATVAKEPS